MSPESSALSDGEFRAALDRLPADFAGRVAERFGVEPDGAPDTGIATLALVLGHGCDRAALADALARTPFFVVERSDDGDGFGDWIGVPPLPCGFHLSLTTGTAFGAQCAILVCDALLERSVLTTERRSVVELCLHEAVANAIVHGNLGISSSAKDLPEGYRVFSQLVSERLRSAEIRRRRVELLVRWQVGRLTVTVADEGSGFDVSALPDKADGNARSGRGFIFMRALADDVTVSDGGRSTSLSFTL